MSGGAITVAGAAVISGRIDLVLSGRWTALLRCSPSSPPSGQVTIDCDGLELVGTATLPRSFLDVTELWVVGGAGGVGTSFAAAYRSAQVRDVLGALAKAAGETLDGSVASSLLGLSLNAWDVSGRVAASLDALALECGRQLGGAVSWRFLPSGKLWMGQEAWPVQAMPAGAYVVDELQSLGAAIVGCESPFALPGYDLEGVGRAGAVTHRIGPDGVRSEVQRWT